MNFFLDENFPRSTCQMLAEMGHSTFDLREFELLGRSDDQIIQKAIELDAIVLTTDRDYFHTLAFANPEHPGIVVIALRKPNREAILTRLRWLINEVPAFQFRNRSFQLRDTTWLARPALPDGG